MEKNKKIVLAAVALVAVIAVFLCVWYVNRPTAQSGAKTVTIEVVHKDGSEKEFVCQTDVEYLDKLLVDEDLIQAEEGEFGLFINAVDGEVADFSVDGGWWCVNRYNSQTDSYEMTTTGISETVLADGDRFQLIYTIG